MNDAPEEGSAKPVVLIVDDTPENLTIMNGLLKDAYRTRVANSGERALKLAAAEPKPDLVLLDIMMPGMDGYEVCRRLKAEAATREIPVIFLTAKTQVEDESRGFEAGCVDYITKPISAPIVLARVRTHLALKAAADFLRDNNAYLAAEVARRTKQISVVQDVTIMAMASLAETRDNETGSSSSASAATMASRPSVVCVFMTSNSSGVSLPGFSRIASGMPTLPMSWSGADLNRSSIVVSSRTAVNFGCLRSSTASSLT